MIQVMFVKLPNDTFSFSQTAIPARNLSLVTGLTDRPRGSRCHHSNAFFV